MRLFIAEKPNLGRAIANGLGNQKKGEGFITCGNDIVTWCFGHMLAQAWPQDYDPAYAQWKRDHLPIIPSQWQNTVKKECSGQLKVIGKLLKEADSVVNAGDPDREGQLLVDEVLEHFNYKGKVERIWLASLDDASVKKAISAICDNSKYLPLRDSAIARSRADWLFGINGTRAMTLKGRDRGCSEVLSIGRVQTPTLALVVARDMEIANFKPVDYFILKGAFSAKSGEFSANLILPETQEGLDESGRLVDGAIAKKLAKEFKDKAGQISSATREEKTKAAPLPHCLSSLQKAASAKLGMSAQQVLDAAQKLYEQKLTTYPRTDCRYLPDEQFQDSGNVLQSLSKIPALEKIAGEANPSLKSSAWNTGKVTAHHAIVPTGVKPSGLFEKEEALYLMIATAYCLQFYPPLRYEAQKISIEVGDGHFEATGRFLLDAGWTAVNADEDEEAQQTLPALEKGHTVHCSEIQVQKKKTTPPPKFTEGTLIEAMANVHRFVADAGAKAQLKEAKGIGTEATRANILETLKERKYLATSKKALVSTPLGREVIDFTPQELKDPITTAEWEARLEAIAEGKEDLAAFLEAQCAVLPELIKSILGNRKIAFPCPQCGAPLLRRQHPAHDTWFWGCSEYPKCKTILPDDNGKPGKPKSQSVLTEFKCPECQKPLRKLNGAKGEFFGCSGYPECKKTFPVGADGKPDFTPRKPAGRKK